MFEELNMHQPLTPNVKQQRKQIEEFQVAKFLAGLRSKYDGVNGLILMESKMPSL